MKLFLLSAVKGTFSNASFFRRFVLTSCALLVCLRLAAQTDDSTRKKNPDSTKFHHLKEVNISADRRYRQATSPTPMQVLNGAELERMNSLSVADAIRFFSGVQLKDYGGVGGLKTINVRSMGTNHTAVFYDGVELGNAQNGQVDLGKFSLDNIEEISLYDGQKSTIFQPARGFASGNSIYLQAKIPVFENGQSSMEKVSFKTGSFGLYKPSVLWQYKISDSIYSSFSAELTESNGRYKFHYTNGVYDTTAIRQNGDLHAYRVEEGLNGKFKDSSTWSAKAYLYDSNQGLPGAIVANKFNYSQRQWDRDAFIQAFYKKDFGKSYSLQSSIKYANDYTRFLDPETITTTGFLDNRYKQQEVYWSAANRYHINTFWDVALSADYQWNKLDANLYRFAYPTRNTELVALATELHFARLNIQGNILGTFVNDHVQYYTGAGSKQEYTPTIMLSWQPFDNPDLRIRSFYKDIFRMPTFNDLYYTFIGNVFLKPEYTKQYDLGLTYNKTYYNQILSWFTLQADAYYNTVKDKIVAQPSQNLVKWSMFNIGKVSVKGIDLNAQSAWQLSTSLHLHTGLSYTYQKAIDVTGGDNYGQLIPYAPVNSGSVLIGADLHQFSLNYSFIYTGYRYDQGANNVYNYLPPWYTHDVALGYGTTYKRHKVKLSAEINNLFNQYYDVITDFPMPGRYYRFTLSFTY